MFSWVRPPMGRADLTMPSTWNWRAAVRRAISAWHAATVSAVTMLVRALGLRPPVLAMHDMSRCGGFGGHSFRFLDGAVGGDFCDDEVPGGEGFPEGVVLESAVRRGDERHNGDVLVRLRFTEFNRL